jgi:hypothetical protein
MTFSQNGYDFCPQKTRVLLRYGKMERAKRLELADMFGDFTIAPHNDDQFPGET